MINYIKFLKNVTFLAILIYVYPYIIQHYPE